MKQAKTNNYLEIRGCRWVGVVTILTPADAGVQLA